MTNGFAARSLKTGGMALACLLAGIVFGIISGVAVDDGPLLAAPIQGAQSAQPPQPAAPRGQAAQVPQRGQGRGQAAATAPCGPSAGLPADVGKNVAPNSRCFELRMYTVDPSRDGVNQFKGGINELHQRFREKELELFRKHGAEVIAAWQNLGDTNTLVWMLAFRDRAHREAVWAAFNVDPEWTALRTKYFVPLQSPNVTFMSATDYSPLK